MPDPFFDSLARIDAQLGADEIPHCPDCNALLDVRPDEECKRVTHLYCVCGFNLASIDDTINCDCAICGFFEEIGAGFESEEIGQ